MSRVSRAVEIFRTDGPVKLLEEFVRFLNRRLDRREQIAAKRAAIDKYNDETKYLNVGGAEFVRDHWRVLDYPSDHYGHDDIFVDFVVDLEDFDQWPIADDSYDLVYSSHTLEHLSDRAVEHTLAECNRILKPGGGIRINVPDVGLAAKHYEERNAEWFRNVYREDRGNPQFAPENNGCPDGYELEYMFLSFFATHFPYKRLDRIDLAEVRDRWRNSTQQAFFDYYTGLIEDEWQATESGYHRNWFTYDRLSDLLSDACFRNIARTDCNKSRFIECCTSDFDNRPHMSLYVDATV